MISLTAIVLTKNEMDNIVECLNSIKGLVERVVVVDSGSTDKTVELAKKHGADVYYNEFEYYAKQFNWGIKNTNITSEWILRLDADERFTPKLCKEVSETIRRIDHTDINGITMEAWYYFLKKVIRYGLRKKRKIMIFRKGFGYIEDRRRDAHTIITGGRLVNTKERFLHDSKKDIHDFIKKYNCYATREVNDYLDYITGNNINIHTDKKIQKQRNNKYGIYYRFPKFIRAKLLFIYNFYFRLGFLDGKEGYIYHFFECYWYRFLVDAKLYEYQNISKELEN